VSLAPGTRLGPYEITAYIGAGGMGEVWCAIDTNLGRQVAIKVLPEAFASDAERLARFEREAKTLASLNHPNIGIIHGLEKTDGVRALVMELVEGPTLAERIEQSSIPLEEALLIATQIAEALEAAHDQGIIHRDLKPANVKVRVDGVVKVLDFGLAKAIEPAATMSPASSQSPTITTPAMTQTGVILGTAAYMAPEQARGKTIDKRADIWAFGCVLYEMLSGRRAFACDNTAETLAHVITKEPEWSTLPPGTPPSLIRLLHRCLEKDPRERLRDIADARLELREAAGRAESPADTVAVRSSYASRVPWVLATVAAALAIGLAAWVVTRPSLDTVATQFTISPPEGQQIVIVPGPTSVKGASPLPVAISPDGRRVAFLAAVPRTGRSHIWIRPLDALAAQALPGTDGASGPFWSPDSRYIAFFANGRLQRIDVTGGAPVVLTEAPDYRGGSWGRDGVIVFSPGPTGPLLKVSDAGGAATPATVQAAGEGGHGRPSFLPDGRRFFYRVFGRGLYLASLDAPDRTLVFEKPDASNVAYAGGYLLFMRGESTLMAQPFDLAAGRLTGEPVRIADRVMTSANPPVGLFSVNDGGVLAYVIRPEDPLVAQRLTWLDRLGKPIGVMGEPGDHSDVQLSPDGTRTAVSIASGLQSDIWIFDNARGVGTRITFDDAEDIAPTWSPDGSRIVFASRRGKTLDLYVKPSSGVGTEELLLADERDKVPTSWSSDGVLLYNARGGATREDLMVLPVSGNRKAVPYLATPFNEGAAMHSPDGKWVAYLSNESGRTEVYVAPFPHASAKWRISTGGGTLPRWSKDGRSVLYGTPDFKLVAVNVSPSAGGLQVGAARELFQVPDAAGGRYMWDAMPDGERFLFNLRREQPIEFNIAVVLNWTNLLRR
jgi:serine/threonine protein kinase/Tol biopolymer transport system component